MYVTCRNKHYEKKKNTEEEKEREVYITGTPVYRESGLKKKKENRKNADLVEYIIYDKASRSQADT